MPLVEYVGGSRDGRCENVPCLDHRLALPTEDGRRQEIYIRSSRRSADLMADVYVHEDHDEVYRSEVARAVAHFVVQFPRHRIGYKINARSIDWRIEYEGEVRESNLARALDPSLSRQDRPHMHEIVQHVCGTCRELSGERLEPPAP